MENPIVVIENINDNREVNTKVVVDSMYTHFLQYINGTVQQSDVPPSNVLASKVIAALNNSIGTEFMVTMVDKGTAEGDVTTVYGTFEL